MIRKDKNKKPEKERSCNEQSYPPTGASYIKKHSQSTRHTYIDEMIGGKSAKIKDMEREHFALGNGQHLHKDGSDCLRHHYTDGVGNFVTSGSDVQISTDKSYHMKNRLINMFF